MQVGCDGAQAATADMALKTVSKRTLAGQTSQRILDKFLNILPTRSLKAIA
jgi:hypothetical protein